MKSLSKIFAVIIVFSVINPLNLSSGHVLTPPGMVNISLETQLDEDAFVNDVIQALKHSSVSVRLAAARALKEININELKRLEEVVDVIRTRLNDVDKKVCEAAAIVLEYVDISKITKQIEFVRSLLSAIREEGNVRKAAYFALDEVNFKVIKDQEMLVADLTRALDDDEAAVCAAAAEKLGKVDITKINNPGRIFKKLYSIAFSKGSVYVRAQAISGIGNIDFINTSNPQDIVKALLYGLTFKEEIGTAARLGLKNINIKNIQNSKLLIKVVEVLLKSLESDDPEVKSAASKMLTEVNIDKLGDNFFKAAVIAAQKHNTSEFFDIVKSL